MEVILLKSLKGLGKVGEIISVKAGYFRNYLSPNKICIVANAANKEEYEKIKENLEAENLAIKKEAEKSLSSINNKELFFIRSSGEAGHLYGSVKILDISKELTKEGISHDKANIVLSENIKNTGVHHAKLFLHPEVSADLLLVVARSEDEASLELSKYKENLSLENKSSDKNNASSESLAEAI